MQIRSEDIPCPWCGEAGELRIECEPSRAVFLIREFTIGETGIEGELELSDHDMGEAGYGLCCGKCNQCHDPSQELDPENEIIKKIESLWKSRNVTRLDIQRQPTGEEE